MSWKRALLLLAAALVAALVLACGDDDEDVADNFATDTPGAQTGAPTDGSSSSECPPKSGEAPEVDVKSYDAAPAMTINESGSYTAVVHTERGDFTMVLRPDLAPQHVNSFVFLARDGYYDGVTFHRVIPGFAAQAGDPTGSGSGGPGYMLPAEFTNEVGFTVGVVGAARTADPNSAGSQWFVTLGDSSHLNGKYTVFAEVTDGMDVVQCLTPRDPQTGPDFEGDKIIGIDIIEG